MLAKKKRKSLVNIGLKDITKADLEIKSVKPSTETHRLIGAPTYELLKSKLITKLMHFGLSEIEIPFAGPKNSLFESMTSRRFATNERVAETLKDLVSQLTRLYHVSMAERALYVDVALERIATEYSLKVDEREALRKDIDFILTDGIKKTFRDNVGRQVPIPEASAMATLVNLMIARMKASLVAGKSLIDVKALTDLISSYSITERRAFLASSEFDKRQIFDELSALTKGISEVPALCMLVKNRLEYSTNAASQTVKLSVLKFAELLNTPVLNISGIDISTSAKILRMESPLLDASSHTDDLDSLSLTGVINYISEVMGAVTMQTSTSDLVNTLFGPEVENFRLSNLGSGSDKNTEACLYELHMILFKLEVMKMLAYSFTTIPPFNSISHQKITQSLNAKLDVYTIEPFIIALDNVKLAYITSFKEAINMVLGSGFTIPTDNEIANITERLTQVPVHKNMLTPEHTTEFMSLTKSALTAFSARKETLMKLSTINESDWRLGRIVSQEADAVSVVQRGMVYDVESHIEKSVDVIMDDGTMTEEEQIAILTGKSGTFDTVPFQMFRYSFGSQTLDDYFAHVSLDTYDKLRQVGFSNGLLEETAGSVVMLDASDNEVNSLIKKKLGFKEDKFWVVKVPMVAIFIPKIRYKLTYINPFTKSMSSITVNSPLVQTGVTAIKSSEVNKIVSNFVKDNTVFSLLAHTWPSISTKVSLTADLTKNKFLASLLPSDEDKKLLDRNFNTLGNPVLMPAPKKDVKDSKLIDIAAFFTEGENDQK